MHTFVGLATQFYMPNTGAGHALQDTDDYNEWIEGSVIQGLMEVKLQLPKILEIICY